MGFRFLVFVRRYTALSYVRWFSCRILVVPRDERSCKAQTSLLNVYTRYLVANTVIQLKRVFSNVLGSSSTPQLSFNRLRAQSVKNVGPKVPYPLLPWTVVWLQKTEGGHGARQRDVSSSGRARASTPTLFGKPASRRRRGRSRDGEKLKQRSNAADVRMPHQVRPGYPV